MKPLRRIAIINRGESALRLIRGVRDDNAQRGTRVETLALITPADLRSALAREADHIVHLPVPPGGGGAGAYLDIEAVIRAIHQGGADAVWVGWGFLAETPAFAKRCAEEGLTFIGPSAEAMDLAGDKVRAKALAEQHDVPVVPWSGKPLRDLDELHEAVEHIGYPLMLKASAGGGGRGIRKVTDPSMLDEAFKNASFEAGRAFGDDRVFVERCVENARHMEVQIAVDAFGHGLAFGVRDCSVQRRHQKLVEECPGPISTPERIAMLERHALAFAKACGYQNVGTVEFLYDLDRDEVYFMEMNTRLQVEHPITELVYGIDLVKTQLDIARGLPLPESAPAPRGYAIELRLNAEDPETDSPAPGQVARLRLPQGPGIRVDTGVGEGDQVPPDFDSMIAKIMAWGSSRAEATARLCRALQEAEILIHGGATNKSRLRSVLEHEDYKRGDFDIHWLESVTARGDFQRRPLAAQALLTAAVISARRLWDGSREAFLAATHKGIPLHLPDDRGQELRLQLGSLKLDTRVIALSFDSYRVYLGADAPPVQLQLDERSLGVARVGIGSDWHRILYEDAEHAVAIEIDGVAYRIGVGSPGVVRAPAPAMMLSIAVKVGDQVTEGQRLGALEVMKAEMPVFSDVAGRVSAILVHSNDQVAAQQALFVVEEEEAEEDVQESEPLDLSSLQTVTPLQTCFGDQPWTQEQLEEGLRESELRCDLLGAIQEELRCVMLGFDYDPLTQRQLLSALDTLSGPCSLAHPEDWASLEEVLRAFVDTESLFSGAILPSGQDRAPVSMRTAFYEYVRHAAQGAQGVHPAFAPFLQSALSYYGLESLEGGERMAEVAARLAMAHGREGARAQLRHKLISRLLKLLMKIHEAGVSLGQPGCELEQALGRLQLLGRRRWPFVTDNAWQTRYVLYHKQRYEHRSHQLDAWVAETLDTAAADAEQRESCIESLVCSPQSLFRILLERCAPEDEHRALAAETILRRLYEKVEQEVTVTEQPLCQLARTRHQGREILSWIGSDLGAMLTELGALEKELTSIAAVDLIVHPGAGRSEALRAQLVDWLSQVRLGDWLSRICLIVTQPDGVIPHHTFTSDERGHFKEQQHIRNLHPELERRMEMWRLSEFELERIESNERLLVYRGRARSNPQDERVFILGEVRDAPAGEVLDTGHSSLMAFEHAFLEAIRTLRQIQSTRDARLRYHWNRMIFHIRPGVVLTRDEVRSTGARLAPYTRGLGLEQVVVRARLVNPEDANSTPTDLEMRFSNPTGHKTKVRFVPPSPHPIPAATPYELKVQRAHRRGVAYPYEVIHMLTSQPRVITVEDSPFPAGSFQEFDLSAEGSLAEVHRPYGENQAGVVVGIISHQTDKHPEGMSRVLVLSDPLRGMGALAESECARLVAAMDLAEERGLPLEWLAASSGARISMDSGTENLDWTARVLRRIVEFTQAGGEINVIVDAVNVGAQSYFNAEATMLMHTRGVLIMTPRGSMVLTGKKALDYSGGVSAEDERGIGGYERIMGRNGQAQFFAQDLAEAFQILLQHYRYTYQVPGEQGVRPHPTQSPAALDLSELPYEGEEGFAKLGDVFSPEHNLERKRPFDMRQLMRAVLDGDGGEPLERFASMRGAETAIVWDGHLGGRSVCLIGFESRTLERVGHVPGDGPEIWTGGTLFPRSSKKVARALNACSGRRPAVILANLSGFDGSPESMRKLQLEYGAEIGRAVVNFQGPILFCVVGRYHGGAYVVFSKALNPALQAYAVEGSFASVIGGAPAAAVVFPREVRQRAQQDAAVVSARQALDQAAAVDRPTLRERLNKALSKATAEAQGEVAREFDSIHSVSRACEVGSLDQVIPASELRAQLIQGLEAGQG